MAKPNYYYLKLLTALTVTAAAAVLAALLIASAPASAQEDCWGEYVVALALVALDPLLPAARVIQRPWIKTMVSGAVASGVFSAVMRSSS